MTFKLLDSFDTSANFWEVNKQLKVIEPFATFYNSDKSKNKSDSSRIMWGVALVFDPNSKYNNYPESDRKTLVARDWLMNKSFKWSDYSNIIDGFIDVLLTRVERTKRIFEKKLEDREKFLDQTPYTLENAKDLDSIVSNTSKLIEILEYLDSKIGKEERTGKTQGDQQESASEEQKI